MKDIIIHGILEEGMMRFCAIDGKRIVQDAQSIHDISRTGTAALGRQLLMTAMLSSQLKNEGDTVTTVLAGDGPGSNMVCVGRYGALVKGYATDPKAELPPLPNGKLNVGGFVGHSGKLTVIKDMGLKDPYVGTCNLVSGEIAEDFAQYFTISEQQPSLVYLGVRIRPESGEVISAGGFLLQTMPGCPDDVIEKAITLAPFVEDLSLRLEDGEELEQIINSIFSRMNCKIVDTFFPQFLCDCSRERMETALIAVGEEELSNIINEDNKAELVCHFCNKKYLFSESDLKQLLQSITNKDE